LLYYAGHYLGDKFLNNNILNNDINQDESKHVEGEARGNDFAITL
jgi:hypothetical protein